MLARKIASLRLFPDAGGVPNLSLIDTGYSALVISQFTLLGDTRKGNRPSYIAAAQPELAVPLYERFVSELGPHRRRAGSHRTVRRNDGCGVRQRGTIHTSAGVEGVSLSFHRVILFSSGPFHCRRSYCRRRVRRGSDGRALSVGALHSRGSFRRGCGPESWMNWNVASPVREFGLALPAMVAARSYRRRSSSSAVPGERAISGRCSWRAGSSAADRIAAESRGSARALRHELTHVALAQSARRGLPRWLNEGLAMVVAGEKQPEQKSSGGSDDSRIPSPVHVPTGRCEAPMRRLSGWPRN